MSTRTLLILSVSALTLVACDDDDGMMPCDVSAGTLSGGPFAFTLDGLPDAVSEITLEGASGAAMVYLVTDADGTILAIEPTLEELASVNFDANDPGTCLIYHMSYQRGIVGADVGSSIDELDNCFELSNSIEVVRTACDAVGGTLDSMSFEFSIDEEADFLTEADLPLSDAVGDTTSYVITNADSTIVTVISDAQALASTNLNTLSSGNYLIWALTRNSIVTNAEPGTFAPDVAGCAALSNPSSLTITCPADGGSLDGGPFVFEIDGESDFLEDGDLTLSGATGDTMTYVVTEEDGSILALPGDYEALQEVDFDGAGAGQCLIWHLSYNGPISGASVGENANDLTGCFSLSNSVLVGRVCDVDGGTLTAQSFSITVDSLAESEGGLPDTIDTSLVVLSGEEGANSTYVVTDEEGVILGLPADLDALGEVNFDAADPGTCLIWHLSFSGEISGAEVGASATAIQGCWDLSNSIEVVRSLP